MKNVKKFLIVLSLVALLLASLLLASCNTPVDSESESVSESTPDTGVQEKTYTVTVMDQKGQPFSGVEVVFAENGENLPSVTTNAAGKASVTVTPSALWTVTLVNVPEGYIAYGDAVAFENGFTAEILIVKDPDGTTAEYAYPMPESGTAEISVPEGGSVWYAMGHYAPIGRELIVTDPNAKVTFWDAGNNMAFDVELSTVEADENGIHVAVPQIGNPVRVTFSTKDGSSATYSFVFRGKPGSSDNPFVLEEPGTFTVSLAAVEAGSDADSGVYYKWVATESGVLHVTCENPQNSITVHNLTAYIYGSPSSGASSVTGEGLAVSAGDEIQFIIGAVSSQSGASPAVDLEIVLSLESAE